MHREHLVVLVCREHGAVRACELQANEHGLNAADNKEEHGDNAIHDAELFVIDGEEPRLPTGRFNRTAEHTVRRFRGRYRRGCLVNDFDCI